MNIENTIVRKPAPSISEGISTADLGKPIFEKAKNQHEKYIQSLEECGVNVRILEPLNNFPDSTFVEDTAIVTKEYAVITNPGANSRKGEEKEMKEIIKEYFHQENIETINPPATLDGGDVMQVENHFYIGLSERTNTKGAQQLGSYLENFGYTYTTIEFENMLHLKTGVSYIGNNTLVMTENLADDPHFSDYDKIVVPDDEQYAANCIRINDFVITPAGFSKTHNAIKEAGFKIKTVDVSEFQKVDGGLSCLSLRF